MKSVMEIFQVYSGRYMTPTERERRSTENVAMSNGQWPVKKVIKERINHRTVSFYNIYNVIFNMFSNVCQSIF